MLAKAHRLDEYLQATTITLEPHQVRLELRLTPGIAVLPIVYGMIDVNADGRPDTQEQVAYLHRILRDIEFTVNGKKYPLYLQSFELPTMESLAEGAGTFVLRAATMELPQVNMRTVRIYNHHQSAIGLYLVNCIQPDHPGIEVISQTRNENQSVYELSYQERGRRSTPLLLFAGFGALAVSRIAYVRRRGTLYSKQSSPSA